MKKKRVVHGPCSEKQRIILQDITTDVILLGGGAGGGKSRVCLTKNLDGIKDQAFRCVILRRYEPELKKPGALIDESRKIYPDFTKIPYKTQAKVWEFPSGATISFSAISCDDDLGSWQGSQVTRIMIDEAGDKWTEKQVLFMLTRLRSESKIHPQLILTCNPDINSFLKGWVDFCLDEHTGVPVPGTEHKIRWFIVEDNKAQWAGSAEECFELYGKPKGMVFALGMSKEEMSKHPVDKLFIPKSFRFVPTGVFDNPYLLPPKNMTYLSSLMQQPYVNQLKFLHGSWTAKESGSMYFNRIWTPIVDFPPNNPVSQIRAWDFAASEKTKTNDPDWTAGVKICRDKVGIYYVVDVVRIQSTTDRVLRTVIETALSDGLDECAVCIPVDPGAGGKTAASYYLTVLAENGIAARTKQTTGHSSKLTRFKPLCALAEAGSLRIVKGAWNDAFFSELENFTGERSQKMLKDDQVDAAADAFSMLARQINIPNFSIPNITQPSPIAKI